MDTKKVNALLTAVNRGSLSAAAEELGYTQSGLTHMMNALEDELGLTLLVRNKAGVQISPAGRELLEDMEALVSAAEALEKDASALHDRTCKTIRIGSYSSVARNWLPAILSEYKFSSPETGTSLSMQSISEQYSAVKNGQLDCAIVSYQPDLMTGLFWTPLRDDELVAILPGTYSIEDGPFPVAYFAGMEFLMPSGGFDMDILPIFQNIPPKQAPDFRYTNMEDAAIISMVAHGLGVSILSRLIMQDSKDHPAIVSLDPPAYRKLGIIVKEKRQNEKAIRTFISCARNTLKNL
ncbi:MAG: LysR family transcriptional regulator [Oscillospiraceae bacterium]|nr:LysR family transcriptional regulator [Oscillospiraceae bacterium]